MEEKDIKQIEELLDKGFEKNFDKAFTKAFINVWENNLEPEFDEISERLDIVQTELRNALTVPQWRSHSVGPRYTDGGLSLFCEKNDFLMV